MSWQPYSQQQQPDADLFISTGGMQDMKRRGQWGHIIHISSMAAYRVPSPSDAFYAATKHALRALAEGLRQEVH